MLKQIYREESVSEERLLRFRADDEDDLIVDFLIMNFFNVYKIQYSIIVKYLKFMRVHLSNFVFENTSTS